MKQLYLKCLLLGILSLADIKAQAYDCQVNGIYYDLDASAKTASVTYLYYSSYYNQYAYTGSVTIPSSITYDGTSYSVTSIGDRAFSGCSDLTSITIPNSVTSIGNYAFYGCSSLTSITIPNSVTSIGNYAFDGCSDLTSITFGGNLTSIGDYAFRYCSSLTSITIPNSVVSIGKNPFYECPGLISIRVDEGNPVFDSRENCNAIVMTENNELIVGCSNTIIPNSVTSIGESAFAECDSLTSITIPNSVTSIGGHAFEDCDRLTSITIPNSVTVIEECVFCDCI